MFRFNFVAYLFTYLKNEEKKHSFSIIKIFFPWWIITLIKKFSFSYDNIYILHFCESVYNNILCISFLNVLRSLTYPRKVVKLRHCLHNPFQFSWRVESNIYTRTLIQHIFWGSTHTINTRMMIVIYIYVVCVRFSIDALNDRVDVFIHIYIYIHISI